jgi:hypothetical protein
MSINQLTPSQLRQAADLQERIAKLQNELATIFGSETKAPTSKAAKPAKRKMSASAIAKIRAAQKARWAKIKGKAKPAVKPVAKPVAKKKISAAGIARIKAAQKARWAKIKATKATPATAPKVVAAAVPAAKPAAKTAPQPAPKPAAKPVKKGRNISPEARAKMAAAAKARWAKVKAAKK